MFKVGENIKLKSEYHFMKSGKTGYPR